MIESSVLFCREETEAQRGVSKLPEVRANHGRARDADSQHRSSGGGVSGLTWNFLWVCSALGSKEAQTL